MAKQNATYVSVWDHSIEVRTHCTIDLDQNPPAVSDVEAVEVYDDYSTLDEEYIDLNGEIINTFTVDETYVVEDGTMIEDAENPID